MLRNVNAGCLRVLPLRWMVDLIEENAVLKRGGQETRENIVALVSDNLQVATVQMVASLGINRSVVSKHLRRLQTEGVARRVGPDRGGHWEVVKKGKWV